MRKNTKQSSSQENIFSSFLTSLTTKRVVYLILLIGGIIFGNILFNGFVWDDWGSLLYNPQITDKSISHTFGHSAINTGIYYRPFFMAYLTTLYSVFSTHAFYYHFIQIAIHITNAFLAFYLFHKFIKKELAFILALFFLVHPIQGEAVAWITATMVPLSFLFGTTALIISLKKNLSIKHFATIFLLLLLCVFTRETGFIYFVLILFFQIIYKRKSLPHIASILGLVTLIYTYFRFVYGKVFADYNFFSPFSELSFWEKIVNTPAVLFYYVKTLLFPYSLAINQMWIVKDIQLFNFYLPLLLLIIIFSGIVAVTLYLRKEKSEKFSAFIFFLLWFGLGCLPLTPFSPLDMTVADRYFYFPFAGLLGMIGIALSEVSLKSERAKKMVLTFTIFVLIVLSLRTIVRNENWKTYFTLVKHDIQIENNFDMQSMYGMLLVHEYNDYTSALPYYLRSVEMFPHETNLKNVGSVYLNMGNREKAKEYFYKALNAKNFSREFDHNRSTYEALATLLFQMKNYEEASRISALGVEDHPDAVQLYMLYAVSEYALKNQPQALEASAKAYELSPDPQTQLLYMQIKENQPLNLNIAE